MSKDISKMKYCACSSLRRTTRAITQFYDKYINIKSTGLCSTQCVSLVTISLNENISVNELAAMTLMDQTTVTRNINVLKKHGYVSISKDSDDARKKVISLTELGTKKLEEVAPIWEKAQAKIEEGLCKDRFQDLLNTLRDIEKLVV